MRREAGSLIGRAALSAVLWAAAQAAPAQEQARLRAGEHGSFSRIALDVPDLGDWTAETRGRTVELRFPARELVFNTRPIFPERRVSRVAGARTERTETGTSLFLSLSCDCTAETYEFQPGMLVIDLRPADARPDSERGASRGSDKTTQPTPAGEREDKTAWDEPPVAEPEAAAAGEEEASEAAALDRSTALTAAKDEAAAPRQKETARREPDSAPDPVTVAEAQRRLLEQLTRAADQGLVDFRPSKEPMPSSSSAGDATGREESPEIADAPSAASDNREAPAPAARGGEPALTADMPHMVQLQARTAFDRDRPAAPRPRAEPCPEDALLDPDLWRPVEDPVAEMAMLRGRLTGEFDRPDAGAALALARLQTGSGFGAEARQTLRAFAPDGAERELLLDLAALLDGGAPSPEGPLSRADACVGRVGAWRLAAGLAPAEADDGAWIDAALAGFGELPVPLRRRLGPGLVETLVEAGEIEAAERARLLLDRAPGDNGDAWSLALARLALAQGERARAETLLAVATLGDGPEATDALLALAESRLLGDGPLDEGLIADLAAAAYVLRGAPEGEQLLVAEILGRAGRRELGAALETVDLEIASDPSRRTDLEGALRRIFEQARASEVGAMNYAAAILAHRALFGDGVAFDAARIRVARELIGIGLANAAADFLAPPISRGSEEARRVMAEAEISAGDPAAALRRIDGLEGPEAIDLRARALAALGRHREAYLAVRTALPADAPKRAELAWLGAAWADAGALPPEDPRRALADRMASEAPAAAAPASDASDGSPSLAGARALLDEAAAVRRDVEEALGGE